MLTVAGYPLSQALPVALKLAKLARKIILPPAFNFSVPKRRLCVVIRVWSLWSGCSRVPEKATAGPASLADGSLENIYKIALNWGSLPGNCAVQSSACYRLFSSLDQQACHRRAAARSLSLQ